MAKLLLLLEQEKGQPAPSCLAVLAFAQRWRAIHHGTVYALLLGPGATQAAATLAPYGLEALWADDREDWNPWLAETYAAALQQLAYGQAIDVVAGVTSSLGKDVLPRLAGMWDAGYVSEVIAVKSQNTYQRMMFAESLFETVQVHAARSVLSVRQAAFSAPVRTEAISSVLPASLDMPDKLGAEVVRLHVPKTSRPDLATARIVVSGGRGLRDKQNFACLEELCDVLHAALGGSRPACDAGMIPSALQVGQTGKKVAPDLYVAVAISGALQHVSGIQNAKVIVAINNDPQAPIFQIADYGWVESWENAIPALLTELRKKVSNHLS